MVDDSFDRYGPGVLQDAVRRYMAATMDDLIHAIMGKPKVGFDCSNCGRRAVNCYSCRECGAWLCDSCSKEVERREVGKPLRQCRLRCPE